MPEILTDSGPEENPSQRMSVAQRIMGMIRDAALSFHEAFQMPPEIDPNLKQQIFTHYEQFRASKCKEWDAVQLQANDYYRKGKTRFLKSFAGVWRHSQIEFEQSLLINGFTSILENDYPQLAWDQRMELLRELFPGTFRF